MKKLLVFILMFIVSINMTFASNILSETSDKDKRRKCRSLGMSKLNPKKSMRYNNKSLKRDKKMNDKFNRQEERYNRKNNKGIVPKFK